MPSAKLQGGNTAPDEGWPSRFAKGLRAGTWLTAQRVKTYPLLLLVLFCVALVALLATSHDGIDRFGRPLGPDFSAVWAAGVEVDAGRPAQPYDRVAHQAAQEKLFGPSDDFYTWPYPPYFLAVAALFGVLPYLVALALWTLATFPLYALAVLRSLGAARQLPGAFVAMLAFPAVFVNLTHGQNGFLTAGLMAGGLLRLNQRPVVAGCLFGLLAYKPQFALALPIALLAGSHWRALIAAAGTAMALTLATFAAFGAESWRGFFAGLPYNREVVLEQGGIGWEKIQSVFAGLRLAGASVPQAYAAQGATSLVVLAGLVFIWRSNVNFRVKAAALLTGSLLATPYCLDYDMVVLGPAVALAVSQGLETEYVPFEKTVLALLWLSPLLARPIGAALHLPCGLLAMLAFFALLLRRSAKDTAPHAWRAIARRA